MSNKKFAFEKENLIIIAVAVLLIIIGFCLMSGGGSTDGVTFNTDIFNARRIKVAPAVTMIGFVLMIVGIVYNKRSDKEDDQTKQA